MLGTGSITAASASFLLAAATAPRVVAPAAILVLCAVAGVGTLMLLPSRREATIRGIGGIVLAVAMLVLTVLIVHGTAGRPATGAGFYFWAFAIIAIVGAVRVVTHPRPVYSALYFVLTVFASAGLFILLAAEFMAAALVLIYAGAILVTYVFVIMLAAQATVGEGATAMAGLADYDTTSREPFVAACAGFALMGVLIFVIFDKAQGLTDGRPLIDSVEGQVIPTEAITGPTQALGEYLFRHQLVNLELAGLILTLSMVGAIVIARRRIQLDPTTATGEVEEVIGPSTPVDDNPHSIPVVGTTNPTQKAYPET